MIFPRKRIGAAEYRCNKLNLSRYSSYYDLKIIDILITIVIL